MSLFSHCPHLLLPNHHLMVYTEGRVVWTFLTMKSLIVPKRKETLLYSLENERFWSGKIACISITVSQVQYKMIKTSTECFKLLVQFHFENIKKYSIVLRKHQTLKHPHFSSFISSLFCIVLQKSWSLYFIWLRVKRKVGVPIEMQTLPANFHASLLKSTEGT